MAVSACGVAHSISWTAIEEVNASRPPPVLSKWRRVAAPLRGTVHGVQLSLVAASGELEGLLFAWSAALLASRSAPGTASGGEGGGDSAL